MSKTRVKKTSIFFFFSIQARLQDALISGRKKKMWRSIPLAQRNIVRNYSRRKMLFKLQLCAVNYLDSRRRNIYDFENERSKHRWNSNNRMSRHCLLRAVKSRLSNKHEWNIRKLFRLLDLRSCSKIINLWVSFSRRSADKEQLLQVNFNLQILIIIIIL